MLQPDTALEVQAAGFMMTSSNGNMFGFTSPLCGEFTGHRRIPSQRPVTRSFDVFFAPEQTTEQTIEIPVIWDTIAQIMTSL